jgi:hypothetical protein
VLARSTVKKLHSEAITVLDHLGATMFIRPAGSDSRVDADAEAHQALEDEADDLIRNHWSRESSSLDCADASSTGQKERYIIHEVQFIL